MHLSLVSLALALATSVAGLSPRSISNELYDNFVQYTKYSSATYQPVCSKPLGNQLIRSFEFNNTRSFIVRDDVRKEIVVAFRGTWSLADVITDLEILLTPLVSPGLVQAVDVDVHWGFLDAYNDVAKDILSIITSQLSTRQYRLVVTGHSLGGSVASIAAVSLKTAFPHTDLKLFTFGHSWYGLSWRLRSDCVLGQPRVGNSEFATYVEDLLGTENIFRAVHTFDGVPTIIPQALGYQHFATEYWQYLDPIPPTQPSDSVTRCVGREDPACSNSLISTGINVAHPVYFGQVMAIDPTLCI
ncbi:Lipase-3 domain-containing protein [Mycena indigotica]|uniref:Lipase-3 domain-containing protein n=1 Tax=Mycena indigotica TaxID=2126181 RepID=A0A8H6SFU9_9AGAR|nr:Lipase-3 domain-containing protein [Mycena indigotica]KAF7298746.1 Lipase-3 domain-containing protein [Mycena indigotica]